MFGLCYHMWVIFYFQEESFIHVKSGTAHHAACQAVNGWVARPITPSQRKSTTRLGLKKGCCVAIRRDLAAKTMVRGPSLHSIAATHQEDALRNSRQVVARKT